MDTLASNNTQEYQLAEEGKQCFADPIVHGLFRQKEVFRIEGKKGTKPKWMALQLALCVANGVKFLKNNTSQCNVLYCNLQMQPRSINFMIDKMSKALGGASHNFTYLNGRDNAITLDKLIHNAQEHDAKLIVIDPYHMIMQLKNKTQNIILPEEAILNKIKSETGAGIAYVAYPFNT